MSAHTYSNPRMHAVIDSWPCGKARTTATFTIETSASKGERAIRTLMHPTHGQPYAPKKLTYGTTARIVDGDDGRTYILVLVHGKSHISVMRATMDLQEEMIFSWGTDAARYADLLALMTTTEG